MEIKEAKLRELWGSGQKISFEGRLYRVGKMSYGDYFLEPGSEHKETDPFNKGTLWPEETSPGNYLIEEIEK